ncbi:MAG: XRE family transcriptional regulator, partial [Nitrosopumilus sp.]|nr:XRE family transcriptional regulator [Nitrosopumilus sp.]
VDNAFISKVERGEKKASREQVLKLAVFLSADKEQLIMLWLCDKIIDVVEDDPMAEEALKMALKNVKTAK